MGSLTTAEIASVLIFEKVNFRGESWVFKVSRASTHPVIFLLPVMFTKLPFDMKQNT